MRYSLITVILTTCALIACTPARPPTDVERAAKWMGCYELPVRTMPPPRPFDQPALASDSITTVSLDTLLANHATPTTLFFFGLTMNKQTGVPDQGPVSGRWWVTATDTLVIELGWGVDAFMTFRLGRANGAELRGTRKGGYLKNDTVTHATAARIREKC